MAGQFGRSPCADEDEILGWLGCASVTAQRSNNLSIAPLHRPHWTQYPPGIAAVWTKGENNPVAQRSDTTILQASDDWGACAGLDRGLQEFTERDGPGGAEARRASC